MTNLVYKLIDKDLWSDFEANRRFDGAPVDHADGFIHLSDAGQVEETARRHFSGQADLMILALDADRLGPQLVWEPSRNAALFTHLYRSLSLDDIVWAKPLPLGPDGTHDFSGLLG